jgi:hypothetical protein
MPENAIRDRLVMLVESGADPGANELGDPNQVREVLVGLADSPLAPLAVAALARGTAEPGQPDWSVSAALFAARLDKQRSVLALLDTADSLLSSPVLAPSAAGPLHEAMLWQLDEIITDAPELAAARLEVALRVVIAGADGVTPYRVLDRLSVKTDGPSAYTGALPRLIGAALDAWQRDPGLTNPLRVALTALAEDPEASSDAWFELGCDRLRAALAVNQSDVAVRYLTDAAGLFERSIDNDEHRDDSTAYAAVCAALVAFVASDHDALARATVALTEVLNRREAWHLNAYLPRWRASNRAAEAAWLGFVLDLETASDRLSEPTWLDANAALGELAAVYRAERSIMPAAGLRRVIDPIVENAIAGSAALADQVARALAADAAREHPLLPSSAQHLLAAVRARHTDVASSDEAADDEEPDPASLLARIGGVAPGLLRLPRDVLCSLGSLDDNQLREAAAYLPMPSVADHPALKEMRDRILSGLALDPQFIGETKVAVTLMTERTLTFLLDRYDRGGPIVPGRPNIIRPQKDGDVLPLEADLQVDFYIWLAAGWDLAGKVGLELSSTATGRADVTVRIGEIRLVTEVKRELRDASRAALESSYLAQSAEYSGSNVPFSQMLVLDLTDHHHGTPSLASCVWHAVYQPTVSTDSRNVTIAVVVGNRPSPSDLKSRPSLVGNSDARDATAHGPGRA